MASDLTFSPYIGSVSTVDDPLERLEFLEGKQVRGPRGRIPTPLTESGPTFDSAGSSKLPGRDPPGPPRPRRVGEFVGGRNIPLSAHRFQPPGQLGSVVALSL